MTCSGRLDQAHDCGGENRLRTSTLKAAEARSQKLDPRSHLKRGGGHGSHSRDHGAGSRRAFEPGPVVKFVDESASDALCGGHDHVGDDAGLGREQGVAGRDVGDRRSERLRFTADGHASVELHARLIDLIAAGDAQGAASVAFDIWHTLPAEDAVDD